LFALIDVCVCAFVCVCSAILAPLFRCLNLVIFDPSAIVGFPPREKPEPFLINLSAARLLVPSQTRVSPKVPFKGGSPVKFSDLIPNLGAKILDRRLSKFLLLCCSSKKFSIHADPSNQDSIFS